LLLALGLVIACGTAAKPVPEPATAPAAPAAPAAKAAPVPVAQPTPAAGPVPAAKYGGVITMQKHAAPGKMDPHPAGDGIAIAEVAPLYNQLVQYSEVAPTDKIVPDLARSWEVSKDGLVYTFHLHENVKWTDGKPLTASDVVFSLDRMVKPGEPRPRAGLLRNYYERSEAVDPTTVKVYLKYPAAAFLPVLGIEYAKILPRHVVEAGVDINLGENAVGSGPFKFVKYVKGDRVEFEKNPNYFKQGLPYVNGLHKFIITDIGRIMAAFQTEQILTQTIGFSNLTVVDHLKLAEDNKGKLTVHRLNDFAAFGMMINTKVKPLDDVRVRRALRLAVDGDALNEAIMANKGMRHGPVPMWAGYGMSEEELAKLPGFRRIADDKKDPQDIAEAKKLLAQAGYAQGFNITMKFRQCCQYAEQTAMLKEQLKAVGINLELIGMESVAGFAAYSAQQFELAVQGNGFAVPDPDVIIHELYRAGGSRNYSSWSNPKVEELYQQQSRATDPIKRKQIVDEIEKVLLNEDSPWVGLYWQPFFWVQSHQLKNWSPPLTVASTGLKFETAWLETK
jgi:peptide/nickel transport system substrate-binding protein